MIDYNNYKLPPGLEYVGDGYTIRKTAVCTGTEALRFMEALCKHLIAHPDPMIVPVYSFEYLGAFADNTHRYQYDMMRMGNITREEALIVWDVGGAWRRFYNQPIDPTRRFAEDATYTVEEAWDKHPKLMHFLKEVVVLNRYHDLHGENIMLDNDAEYRIIDLEGFKNPPLEQPSNAWITHTCAEVQVSKSPSVA